MATFPFSFYKDMVCVVLMLSLRSTNHIYTNIIHIFSFAHEDLLIIFCKFAKK